MRKIEQSPFAKIDLRTVLHLDDDVVAIVCGTINIVNHAAVALEFRLQFFVQKSNILNMPFTYQQIVQKVDQQILCHFLSENDFESDICKRIDKLRHDISVFIQR